MSGSATIIVNADDLGLHPARTAQIVTNDATDAGQLLGGDGEPLTHRLRQVALRQ